MLLFPIRSVAVVTARAACCVACALLLTGARSACSLACALLLLLLTPARASAQERSAAAAAASDAAAGSAATPEVSVIGERRHPTAGPRDAGVSASVVRRARLEQPGSTAVDVLREEPGVQVSQLGGFGAPATASLRGASAAQTPVYLAGVRINDEVGGVVNLADLPLFLLERVEIYRSNAPSQASSLGIGGAIFFEPRQLRESELSLGATAGSFALRGARAHVGVREGERHVLAGFSIESSENDYEFQNSEGTLFVPGDDGAARLQNADAAQSSFWMLVSDSLGAARVQLLFNHAEREQGAPKLAQVASKLARVGFDRDLVGLKSELPIAAWDGQLELLTSVVRARTSLRDPHGELGLPAPATSTEGERVEQLVGARQRPRKSLQFTQQLSLSAERLRRFEDVSGRSLARLAARRVSLRGALGAELSPLPALGLNALVELRCFDTGSSELELCPERAPGGRVGARVLLGPAEAYASLAHYERLATLSELYGVGLLVRGNDSLVPETGDTLEIGARYQLSEPERPARLWVDVAGFARASSHIISYVRSAQGYLHPVNRRSARTLGAEFAVGAEPLRGLSLQGQLSLLDPRDTSADRVTHNDLLPFLSRSTSSLRVRYEWRLGSAALEGAAAGARYDFQSSRYADPAGQGVVPAQGTLDLELEASGAERVLVARAVLSNLWDAERFDVVGFPLPGRSAFFSMEATW